MSGLQKIYVNKLRKIKGQGDSLQSPLSLKIRRTFQSALDPCGSKQ